MKIYIILLGFIFTSILSAQDITNTLGSNGTFKVQNNSASDLFTISSTGDVTVNGSLSVSNAYTLPVTDGASGAVMQANGNGTSSWVNPNVQIKFLICVAGVFPSDGSRASSFFLGQIVMFAGQSSYSIPSNFRECDGSLIPISQNSALFSLIGVQYGGNGTTNFALPDFRSKTPQGGL